ncbi:MAG: hypothetical protein IRY94_02220 [Rhodospirillaceae bacterium]|nr:hypothetical protein [Rhodospirillaceae bacterium]
MSAPPSPRDAAPREVPLAEKVAALGQPSAYPEGTAAVEAIETHWSWVFLTDAHAYKLKKPMRQPFFDFTTLAARRLNCEEEVRLNRRLAADIYLGVVPLGRIGDRLVLGAEDGIVDWLVRMRRLPEARTLRSLIESRAVPAAGTARLADTLGAFYARAERAAAPPDDYLRRFAADIDEIAAVLATAAYGLAADAVAAAVAAARALLADNRAALAARAASGAIVEGHGDLRPEHVYLLEDGPRVLDCLEFSRTLRTVDPVDELSFLALECERLGDRAPGATLLAAWERASGRPAGNGLVAFYTAYRALLRARFAIAHLDDAAPDAAALWRARAEAYLDMTHAARRRAG